MDIHEYQGKQILAEHGVPVPPGKLAYSPEQAVYVAQELGGDAWAVKAQVHAGARGKGGGVRICHSPDEIWDAADALLGRRLVTPQTDAQGKLIHRLYVEAGCEIQHEYYIGLALDRETERVVMVASTQGGMDIEEITREHPDAVHRISIEPAVGLQRFEAREIAYGLGLAKGAVPAAVNILIGIYRAFRDKDATLLEINPLIVTGDGRLLALDCKMSFDDNALFRHPEIAELRDKTQEDPRETQAVDRGLSYVGLEGNIGCIINGAGLAMATMDMIKHAGGEPANFLDIGGGASPERVAKAFRLVAADKNVRAILVNIFAGINRCDWVASGVIQALEKQALDVPLVVRLSGTNVELGQKMIRESGLPIVLADTLREAADAAVAAMRDNPGA